jgi:fatty-acyl-CoA synthase
MSHVIGDTSEPLNEETILELFFRTVSSFPEWEADVFTAQNIRWNWAELAVKKSTSPNSLEH